MKSARVADFHTILIGLLTQYDAKESQRELDRRGRSNIYRLGHLFKAAEEVEKKSKSFGIWERDDVNALMAYHHYLTQHFIYSGKGFALAPLRQLDKKIDAWLDRGKLPTYGKLRANPTWTKVFGG